LLGWHHGFESPFKAGVYFINTTRITDLKWGTPNPVIMRDPDFGPVRVRTFGTYSMRAVDGERLLNELVGTDSVFEADEISEWLRSIINTAFADVIADSGICVLDLAGHYQELSETLRDKVHECIDREYGLELPKLNIVNISLPAEVEKAIYARSSMGIVGDLAQYQAFQIAQAVPDAAKNPAGGIAGAGLGMGMAGPMLQGQTAGQSQGAATPPPLPPARNWHVADNGESTGPFPEPQMIEAIRAGRVRRETLVWSAGMEAWVEAVEVPGFAAQFALEPPALPRGRSRDRLFVGLLAEHWSDEFQPALEVARVVHRLLSLGDSGQRRIERDRVRG
jgi:hypothetical protein